mmetsp:Transcript_32702/g.60813  ORF Transcript_32702/g.60813 Transcript_32702/m.60813 type:complete len:192 (-) Transcript_32702:235-810(-)
MLSIQECRNSAAKINTEIGELINQCHVHKDLITLETKLKDALSEFKASIARELNKASDNEKKVERAYSEDTKGNASIRITAVKEMHEHHGKFHCYEVVSYVGKKYGKTLARYSGFWALNKEVTAWMKKEGKSSLIENIPALPKATPKLFGAHDVDFINSRRSELEDYLNKLAKLPSIFHCPAVRKFLELGS